MHILFHLLLFLLIGCSTRALHTENSSSKSHLTEPTQNIKSRHIIEMTRSELLQARQKTQVLRMKYNNALKSNNNDDTLEIQLESDLLESESEEARLSMKLQDLEKQNE